MDSKKITELIYENNYKVQREYGGGTQTWYIHVNTGLCEQRRVSFCNAKKCGTLYLKYLPE